MEIAIDEAGPTATVVLTGRLDIAGAEQVALPLATLSGAKTSLVLDMSGVTFMASIGLRHLVSAAKAVARRGGGLVLRNPNAAIVDVIATAGLADLLPIVRSPSPA